jgi:hypothetical protein
VYTVFDKSSVLWLPSLPTTPPAAQLQHTVTFVPLKTPPLGHTTTTGLNPSSSSRFTLSIPLLGRANLVPLGSVLGKEKEKGGLCCVDLFVASFRY